MEVIFLEKGLKFDVEFRESASISDKILASYIVEFE